MILNAPDDSVHNKIAHIMYSFFVHKNEDSQNISLLIFITKVELKNEEFCKEIKFEGLMGWERLKLGCL